MEGFNFQKSAKILPDFCVDKVYLSEWKADWKMRQLEGSKSVIINERKSGRSTTLSRLSTFPEGTVLHTAGGTTI